MITETDNLVAAIQTLRRFIGTQQINTMTELCRGEEGEFFRAKILELHELVEHYMPKTHDTDGEGDNALVYLHYFRGAGAGDWYITERDMLAAQHQAFGYANPLGDDQCAELGYISIVELIRNDVELDLHWDVVSLAEIKGVAGIDPGLLKFYDDPGHGWLSVPIDLLQEYDLTDKISTCSYRKGDTAYLEEDCDLARFIEAIGSQSWQKIKDKIENCHLASDNFIRNLPSFHR